VGAAGCWLCKHRQPPAQAPPNAVKELAV
jgi:hypothetical protein